MDTAPPPPSSTVSRQRRIKRHVVGRVRAYFAVTAPGWEEECRRELMDLPQPPVRAVCEHGGVRFQGRLDTCCLANLHLRTASRILLPVATIHATRFAALETGLERVAWELYLRPATSLHVRVSAHACRLYHTEAVAERVARAVTGRLERCAGAPAVRVHAPAAPPADQLLVVRGLSDRFTVSLDSSGDLLHKRGLKQDVGRAPVRETLAAGILARAGYGPGTRLLDPMCGSGTFALEAAMILKGIPAGWYRGFAFMQWPSFQPRQWDFWRRSAQARMCVVDRPPIEAADIDPQRCERLRRALEGAGLADAVGVRQADFFDPRNAPARRPAGLLVLNPPYGHRLGGDTGGARPFAALVQHLRRYYPGWRFALLAPDDAQPGLTGLPGRRTRIRHGGLTVTLVIGRLAAGS